MALTLQIPRIKSKPKIFQCLRGTGKSKSAEDMRYLGLDMENVVVSRRNKSGGTEENPVDNNNTKPPHVPRILVHDHDDLFQIRKSERYNKCIYYFSGRHTSKCLHSIGYSQELAVVSDRVVQ